MPGAAVSAPGSRGNCHFCNAPSVVQAPIGAEAKGTAIIRNRGGQFRRKHWRMKRAWLYRDEAHWQKAQSAGYVLLADRYNIRTARR